MSGWARAGWTRCRAWSRCEGGLFDGAQPGSYAVFAGGDGLAVASTAGTFGQVLAGPFDFADVGFAFVGVGSDGEQGDVRGGVV